MKKPVKEIHGVRHARRIAAIKSEETQAVMVRDGLGEVEIVLSACSYPAGLTPDQARMIAKLLNEAADRVEAKS